MTSQKPVLIKTLKPQSNFRLVGLEKYGKIIYITTGSAYVEYKVPRKLHKQNDDGTIIEKDILGTDRVCISLNTLVFPIENKV